MTCCYTRLPVLEVHPVLELEVHYVDRYLMLGEVASVEEEIGELMLAPFH